MRIEAKRTLCEEEDSNLHGSYPTSTSIPTKKPKRKDFRRISAPIDAIGRQPSGDSGGPPPQFWALKLGLQSSPVSSLVASTGDVS